jgi:hypothetical protein
MVRVICGWPGLYSRTVCRTCKELWSCCLILCLRGRLIYLNDLWPPPLLWWGALWMCVIKYFFLPPFPGSPSLLGTVIFAFGTVSISMGTIDAWSILDRLF